MKALLFKLLIALTGSLIARALVGAGLTLVGYAAFLPLLTHGLNMVNNHLTGLDSDFYNILMLGGLGDVLSVLGSAMLTRVSMLAGIAGLARVYQAQNP